MKSWIPTASALLALSGVGAGLGLLSRSGAFDEVPPGVSVGGRVIARGASLGPWLDARREALGAREVTLQIGGDYERASLGELGVEIDVGAALRAVRARLEVPLLERFALLRDAREGAIDLPLRYRLDRDRAAVFLSRLAPRVRREPVNARLDLMSHTRVDDVPGAELDLEATLGALGALAHEDGEVLVVATRPVRAAFASADIAGVDVSKVLSSAETGFVTYGVGAGRAVNIATAARRLDGWVLAPGESFSFNQVVGPRTLEAGFTYAPEIVGDELEMGVGGGTCQVASTLHSAALFGALEVQERHNHGRPSAYTKLGLDATVAYGKVDLALRNPFPFAVILHAFLPRPTSVRVEILGADPAARVTYTYAVNKSDDFFRRITLKPGLPANKVVLHQKGQRGAAVMSQVLTSWPDGRVTERSYFSEYRPVPEVFWVGPDFDETSLPQLPDGAARVERRGVPTPPPTAEAPRAPGAPAGLSAPEGRPRDRSPPPGNG